MSNNWNKNEIKEQIKKVIKYSQDFETHEPKVDALYDKWYKNKLRFIDSLNGELIYEYPQPICFEMSEEDKVKNVEDFITDISLEYAIVKNIDEICRFFEECKQDIYKNILQNDFTFINSQDETCVIKKGIKINKALKFFFYDEEKEQLTNLQMAVSRLIQKDKVQGKLCLSVHPLDFLSSSENTYNWRSCHSLDGEYRAGNLSYMVDKATVICYLKSEEDAILPNFPSTIKWNNKKWRVLIHISNDENLMFAGRQYPFSSEKALDLVKNLLISHLYPKNFWTDWTNKQIKSFKFPKEEIPIYFNSSYIPIEYKLKAINEIIKEGPDHKNYNDVLYSNYYDPYYSYNSSSYTPSDKTIIEIGESIPCLCCEEESVGLTDIFRCIKCEEKYGIKEHPDFLTCDICGKRTFYRKIHRLNHSSEVICDDCIEEKKFKKCDFCGTVFEDETELLSLKGEMICKECYDWRT